MPDDDFEAALITARVDRVVRTIALLLGTGYLMLCVGLIIVPIFV